MMIRRVFLLAMLLGVVFGLDAAKGTNTTARDDARQAEVAATVGADPLTTKSTVTPVPTATGGCSSAGATPKGNSSPGSTGQSNKTGQAANAQCHEPGPYETYVASTQKTINQCGKTYKNLYGTPCKAIELVGGGKAGGGTGICVAANVCRLINCDINSKEPICEKPPQVASDCGPSGPQTVLAVGGSTAAPGCTAPKKLDPIASAQPSMKPPAAQAKPDPVVAKSGNVNAQIVDPTVPKTANPAETTAPKPATLPSVDPVATKSTVTTPAQSSGQQTGSLPQNAQSAPSGPALSGSQSGLTPGPVPQGLSGGGSTPRAPTIADSRTPPSTFSQGSSPAPYVPPSRTFTSQNTSSGFGSFVGAVVSTMASVVVEAVTRVTAPVARVQQQVVQQRPTAVVRPQVAPPEQVTPGVNTTAAAKVTPLTWSGPRAGEKQVATGTTTISSWNLSLPSTGADASFAAMLAKAGEVNTEHVTQSNTRGLIASSSIVWTKHVTFIPTRPSSSTSPFDGTGEGDISAATPHTDTRPGGMLQTPGSDGTFTGEAQKPTSFADGVRGVLSKLFDNGLNVAIRDTWKSFYLNVTCQVEGGCDQNSGIGKIMGIINGGNFLSALNAGNAAPTPNDVLQQQGGESSGGLLPRAANVFSSIGEGVRSLQQSIFYGAQAIPQTFSSIIVQPVVSTAHDAGVSSINGIVSMGNVIASGSMRVVGWVASVATGIGSFFTRWL